MKFRTYWVIIQPPTLVVMALIGLAAAGAFHWLAPFASHRTGAAPFVALILLGPFFAGCIFSHSLHAPLHRPFSITLPHLRRNILQWHIPTLAIFALLLSHWAYKLDPSLPRPVTASVAFAGLCLMLPFEAGLLWYGSGKRLLAITCIVLLGACWANETRTVLLFLPALTVAGSLALAALCCRLTFDRSRLRKRARTPLSSMAETPSAETEQRQTIADSPRLGRSWTHGAVGDSTDNWIRAMLHEAYGYQSRFVASMLALPVVAYLIVFPVIAYVSSHLLGMSGYKVPLGQFIYRCIWEHEPFGQPSSSLQQILLIPLLISLISYNTLPRPQPLYPISRERRARLTFILTLRQGGIQFLVGLSIIMALSWVSAWLAGWPFRPSAVPDFLIVFLALSPLAPLVQWRIFHTQLTPTKQTMDGTIYMIISVVGGALFMFVTSWRRWLLSPAGLTVIAVAFAISLYAFRAALFRFYRRADLLQRKPSR